MHITINAMSSHAGGGLTVVCGLLAGLRHARPDWRLSALAGNSAAYATIRAGGHADDVACITPPGGAAGSFVWQNTRLGSRLVRDRCDVVVTINYFLRHIDASCKQVVYHLNLGRFVDDFRPRRLALQESVRNWAARSALERADANVFESRFLQNAAQRRHGPVNNGHIVYIGVPDTLIGYCGRDAVGGAGSRRLATITSPHAYKDNPTLIRMLGELVRRAPGEPWRLEIIGGVDDRAWGPMRRLASELGVLERIAWHGFRSQAEISAILRGALCLPFTSRLESFCMVALESMARGCPPIVADAAAMPESVGNAGLIARAGDPASFAEQVLAIAGQPNLRQRLVENGWRRLEQFRGSACGAAFAEISEGVCRTRPAARAA